MAGLVDLIVPEKLMAYSFKNYYQRNLWHTLSKTIMLIPFTLSYLHLIAKESLVAKVQPPIPLSSCFVNMSIQGQGQIIFLLHSYLPLVNNSIYY